MIDAWKWNSLAKIVYTDNIRFVFKKNVFNPHPKSVLSIFFCSKYTSMIFSKTSPNFVQLVEICDFFGFFFYNKIILVYRLFFEKKKQKNDTGGKKVGKKSSTRIYTGISTFFCPKLLLQNHAQYPNFCIFF